MNLINLFQFTELCILNINFSLYIFTHFLNLLISNKARKYRVTELIQFFAFNSFMFILLGKVQEILAIISLRYVYTYLHRKKYQLRFTAVLYTVFTFTAFLIQIQITIWELSTINHKTHVLKTWNLQFIIWWIFVTSDRNSNEILYISLI